MIRMHFLVAPLSHWVLSDRFIASRPALDQLSGELRVIEMSRDEQRYPKLVLKYQWIIMNTNHVFYGRS